MRRVVFVLSVGLMSLLASQSAQAALMGTYDFNTETAVPTYSGATFGAFTRSTVTADTSSGVFRSLNWSTSSTIDVNRYVQFILSPTSGNTLTLNQIIFDVAISDPIGANHGPYKGEVAIFLGNNPANNATPNASQQWTLDNATPVTETFNFALSVAEGQSVTVRFYGWNDKGANFLQFDNVNVFGAVTPVPEPVNVALGVFSGVFLVVIVTRSQPVRNRVQRCRVAVVQWVDAV
jgi:hypothetical protein